MTSIYLWPLIVQSAPPQRPLTQMHTHETTEKHSQLEDFLTVKSFRSLKCTAGPQARTFWFFFFLLYPPASVAVDFKIYESLNVLTGCLYIWNAITCIYWLTLSQNAFFCPFFYQNGIMGRGTIKSPLCLSSGSLTAAVSSPFLWTIFFHSSGCDSSMTVFNNFQFRAFLSQQYSCFIWFRSTDRSQSSPLSEIVQITAFCFLVFCNFSVLFFFAASFL